MNLLILTQAVDTQDRALGFFHLWLEKLSEKFETVETVCLKEGTHHLPANVRTHSLGKESGRSRGKYLYNLYRYIFSLQYDAVFVHMNEEYVLLCGIWWRLTGKRVVLWRNHKMGTWRTRLAVVLSTTICYTSPDAFVAYSNKAVRMPVGIDTDFFRPAVAPAGDTILFLGRLDPVKKAELFVEALKSLDAPFKADLYGSPTEAGSTYATEIKRSATAIPSLSVHEGVAFVQTKELYQSHMIYVNLTPSGSFDKTIGEAMASGCLVVCANKAVQDIVPSNLFALGGVIKVAGALGAALAMSNNEREAAISRQRMYIEKDHSLALLIERLASILTPR